MGTRGGETSEFSIIVGLHQGSILNPCFFAYECLKWYSPVLFGIQNLQVGTTRKEEEDIRCNFSKIKNSNENKVKLNGQKVSEKDNF